MQKENTYEIRNKILKITDRKKIDVYNPSILYFGSDLTLDAIINKLDRKDSTTTLLWNLRPWDNYNLVHAIYYQKINELVEIGFRCVVIIYDKLIENHPYFLNYDKRSLEISVENNINWMQRAIKGTNSCEFITESDLWSLISFKCFAGKFLKICNICGIDIESQKKTNSIVSIIENLWVLAYEDTINCDIAITGENDKINIWGMLRNNLLNSKSLNDYHPPIILYFPTLIGIDGMMLNPYNPENSISTKDSEKSIRDKILIAPVNFLETLYDFLILRNSYDCRPDFYEHKSFEKLIKELDIEELRQYAINYLITYFNKFKL